MIFLLSGEVRAVDRGEALQAPRHLLRYTFHLIAFRLIAFVIRAVGTWPKSGALWVQYINKLAEAVQGRY